MKTVDPTLYILSVVFLKPTALIRPSVPPSGSHKCLRFSLWSTLCTITDLLTYLLTYMKNNKMSSDMGSVPDQKVPNCAGHKLKQWNFECKLHKIAQNRIMLYINLTPSISHHIV